MIPLYPATTSITSTSKTLLSKTSGWFYVKILVLLSSIDLKNIKDNQNIIFSSDKMLSTGVFKMYLTEQETICLPNKNIAKIIPIEKKLIPRLQSVDKNMEFLVQATPDYMPPSGSYISNRITDDLFTVKGATYSQLMQDERVLLADELPDTLLMN